MDGDPVTQRQTDLSNAPQIEQKVKGGITGSELGPASQHPGNGIALAELDQCVCFALADTL